MVCARAAARATTATLVRIVAVAVIVVVVVGCGVGEFQKVENVAGCCRRFGMLKGVGSRT